jgi:YegS/Rv2252/BmrU family lipid kinase
MDSTRQTDGKRIVLNPVSGSGDHVDAVGDRALLTGFEVAETEGEGDAVDLARTAAAEGASLIAAAGGDGTLNEVVRGVAAADALDRVTVGVVPVGTGNNFAGNIGVGDVDEAFDVLEHGERRRIDLGVAEDHLFVNSCIAGLTADASGETDPELKNRYGILAYVVNSVQRLREYDGLRLSVDLWRDGETDPVWTGDALLVLVGNGRRFSLQGNTQARVEDGLFDVTIVENAPTADLVEDAVLEGILGRETAETVRLRASGLELRSLEGDPIPFSLDGEMVETDSLSLDVHERALTMAVGEEYDPTPLYEDE